MKAESPRVFKLSSLQLSSLQVLSGLALLLIAGMFAWGPQATLDKKLYYTGAQAQAFLDAMSPELLHAYFINELLDELFLCCYSVIAFVVFKRVFGVRSRFRFLAFMPGFFDWIETSLILIALRTPAPHAFFGWLGFATFLKWTTGGALSAALAAGAIKRRASGS